MVIIWLPANYKKYIYIMEYKTKPVIKLQKTLDYV